MHATALPQLDFPGRRRFARRYARQLFPSKASERRYVFAAFAGAASPPTAEDTDKGRAKTLGAFERYQRLRKASGYLTDREMESLLEMLPMIGRCGQPEDIAFLIELLDTAPERYECILRLAVLPILLRFESIRISGALRRWMEALTEEYPKRRSAVLARYLLQHD